MASGGVTHDGSAYAHADTAASSGFESHSSTLASQLTSALLEAGQAFVSLTGFMVHNAAISLASKVTESSCTQAKARTQSHLSVSAAPVLVPV